MRLPKFLLRSIFALLIITTFTLPSYAEGDLEYVVRGVEDPLRSNILNHIGSLRFGRQSQPAEKDFDRFLAESIADAKEALRPYGWIGEDEGFLGATPEVLFRYFDGRIYTMALAGTARSDERMLFAVDDKEIREHEFVAQTLIAKLSDLGMVIRSERDILDLGRLIHFQTLIKVELYQYQETKVLIERLHPTPALGPLPRTTETMNQLRDWRERLECPVEFGAPFGLLRDGEFEALVAIRMVAWKGSEFSLPSGCGVIQESRLVNEWRELALKRNSVSSLFFPSK